MMLARVHYGMHGPGAQGSGGCIPLGSALRSPRAGAPQTYCRSQGPTLAAPDAPSARRHPRLQPMQPARPATAHPQLGARCQQCYCSLQLIRSRHVVPPLPPQPAAGITCNAQIGMNDCPTLLHGIAKECGKADLLPTGGRLCLAVWYNRVLNALCHKGALEGLAFFSKVIRDSAVPMHGGVDQPRYQNKPAMHI